MLNKNKQKKFLDILIKISILSIPLYIFRLNFFLLKTNVFELFSIFTIIFAIFYFKKNFFYFYKIINKYLLFSIFFIILGIMLSTFFNKITFLSLGIMKGWFIVPILFAYIIFLKQKLDKNFNIIFYLYLSSFFVATISLFYKIFNIVTYDDRLKAFYDSPNHLAMFLAIGLLINVYYLFENKNIKIKTLFCFSLFIFSLTIYFTYSYSSFLALFFSILLLAYNKFSKKFFYIFSLLFILIFFSQLNTAKLNSIFDNFERSSLNSRIIIWKSASMLIKDNPVIGIGPGNFQEKYLEYQKFFPPYLEWSSPQPHNIFLAFWLQGGFIGFFGFILLIFSLFKIIFSNKDFSSSFKSLFLAFFVYTIIHGLFDTTYWKNDLSAVFWIFVFLTNSLYSKETL